MNAGGAGGGWRDAVPWPSSAETGVNVFAEVTSIANLTTLSQITVNSTAADPPKAGDRFRVQKLSTAFECSKAIDSFFLIPKKSKFIQF